MSWEAWGDPPDPPLMIECPECGGSGDIPDDGTNQGECPECGGSGEVEDDNDSHFDDDVI